MAKRLSAEERARRLAENENFIVKQTAARIHQKIENYYGERIARLNQRQPRVLDRVQKNVDQMKEHSKTRYIFFRARGNEIMGFDPEEARRRAEAKYDKSFWKRPRSQVV